MRPRVGDSGISSDFPSIPDLSETDAILNFIDSLGDLGSTEDTSKTSGSSAVGGINFDPSLMTLETNSSSGAIEFHFDPSTIKDFENSSGLTPVVTDFRLMKDLNAYLGSPPVPTGR